MMVYVTTERVVSLADRHFGAITRPITAYLQRENRIKISSRFATCHVNFEDLGDPPYIEALKLHPYASDLTLLHEIGHLIHCWYWPAESASFGEHAAERCADWCAMRLGLPPEPDLRYRIARVFFHGSKTV